MPFFFCRARTMKWLAEVEAARPHSRQKRAPFGTREDQNRAKRIFFAVSDANLIGVKLGDLNTISIVGAETAFSPDVSVYGCIEATMRGGIA
jgi:hypothetical protein